MNAGPVIDRSVRKTDDGFMTDFSARYRHIEAGPLRRAEMAVIGADYGATSYTTRREADDIARRLGLSRTDRLLDVGAGAGWPSVYLALATGCEAVLVDVPPEGLAAAKRRIGAESVRAVVVMADGGTLPFRDSSFTAAVSSDALC